MTVKDLHYKNLHVVQKNLIELLFTLVSVMCVTSVCVNNIIRPTNYTEIY